MHQQSSNRFNRLTDGFFLADSVERHSHRSLASCGVVQSYAKDVSNQAAIFLTWTLWIVNTQWSSPWWFSSCLLLFQLVGSEIYCVLHTIAGTKSFPIIINLLLPRCWSALGRNNLSEWCLWKQWPVPIHQNQISRERSRQGLHFPHQRQVVFQVLPWVGQKFPSRLDDDSFQWLDWVW